MGFKVAIVGATGNVGREMLNILAEREFPVDEVIPLASSRSIGKEVSFGDKTLKTRHLDTFDFAGTDIVLMSAGGTVSGEWSPRIARQGPVVIDDGKAQILVRQVFQFDQRVGDFHPVVFNILQQLAQFIFHHDSLLPYRTD